MRRRRLSITLVMPLLLALAACRSPPKVAHTDPARWSCGTAAAVCTCIPLDTSIGALAHPCDPSPCCFVSRDGSCTCRLGAAALDCDALRTALAAATQVGSCPP